MNKLNKRIYYLFCKKFKCSDVLNIKEYQDLIRGLRFHGTILKY